MSEELVARLEAAVSKLDKGGDVGGEPPQVSAHTELLNGPVKAFANAASAFPDLKKVVEWTNNAFRFEHNVVQATAVCAKPSDEQLMAYVQPIVDIMTQSSGLPPKGEFFNHYKAATELFAASGWLVQGSPRQFIETQIEATKLYTNKILMAAKNLQDPAKSQHQAFAKSAVDLLTAWAEYANEYFKTGLTWKIRGSPLGEFKAGGGGGGAARAEGKRSVDERLAALIERVDRVAAKLNKRDDGAEPRALAEHKALVEQHVTPVIQACEAIPELKKMAEWTRQLFDFESKLIAATAVCAKPSDEEFGAFLAPLGKIVDAAGNVDKRSPFANHQQAYSEFAQALTWVAQPGPVTHIQTQLDSAGLYLTKILMAVKDKADPEKANNRAFANTIKALLTALAEFAKEHYNMGLVWKQGGKKLSEFGR